MIKKCQYKITNDGFKIKKLIGSRTIPFDEIKSIRLQDGGFTLTDHDGEEILKGPAVRAAVVNDLHAQTTSFSSASMSAFTAAI